MQKDEKKSKENVDGVITVVYKVNLHCPQCACRIKKPLMKTEGVHRVDANMESCEIKVQGRIDPKKIHEKIKKLSKKKVEMVLTQAKAKDIIATEKKGKDTKEPILRTTAVKVHMHCEKCEHDLRKKLLNHKGVYNVKTDMKAQTLTVEGIIESNDLLGYIRKKVHKHAEIIPPKQEKKEEKKEKVKVETKSIESTKEEEKKEKVKAETKSFESTKITEVKAKTGGVELKTKEITEFKTQADVELKTKEITEFNTQTDVELKTKESNVPYFIHYVYAPQLFSDENPNACSIM